MCMREGKFHGQDNLPYPSGGWRIEKRVTRKKRKSNHWGKGVLQDTSDPKWTIGIRAGDKGGARLKTKEPPTERTNSYTEPGGTISYGGKSLNEGGSGVPALGKN